MALQSELVDLMELRRKRRDALGFMTRSWRPQLSHKHGTLSPAQLKEEVRNSVYMKTAIQELSSSTGASESSLRAELDRFLEQLCLGRRMCVVRALGVAFIRTALAMRVGILVNERRIFQLKSVMGDNPVLFLPTHRSYGDFVLMTYLCYHYEIHLPAVAAGVDFYHMAGMGRIMRDTGAFYIPRSLAGAPLAARALRRYVRALVTRYPAPLEFFIEGARSRSNKSLQPKYGLLSMALLPYFTREVPDVTLVPVSISYDRIVEQTLFAYEHLGVPKPRETTRGLLRTLSFLNDDFGDIYMSIGEPVQVSSLAAGGDAAEAGRWPLELQALTAAQSRLVAAAAERVIDWQQELTILTTYNLVSTCLLVSVVEGTPLSYDQLTERVRWLDTLLQSAGAQTCRSDGPQITRALHVHRAAAILDRRRRLRLLCPPVPATTHTNTRGHAFSAGTLQTALPLVTLQLYVNPVGARLLPAALLHAAARGAPVAHDELVRRYRQLRSLHRHEFVSYTEPQREFDKWLRFCVSEGALAAAATAGEAGAGYAGGACGPLRRLLDALVLPSLHSLLDLMHVARKLGSSEERALLRLTQQHAEGAGGAAEGAGGAAAARHPYCLSLEALRQLAAGLRGCGALTAATVAAENGTKETHYTVNDARLTVLEELVRHAAPAPLPPLGANPVLMLRAPSML